MSLNHIEIMGRMGDNPTVRYTQSQKAVATVNVAVDRDLVGADGVRGTDWIPVVAWGKSAEFLANNFHKGDPIVISGRLQMRSWEDKNGNKRVSAEVVADRLYFVPKSGSNQQSAEPALSDLAEPDGELPF